MVGEQIGAYRVTRKLGEGGMGTVWEAVHETLGRRVAIKMLHPDLCKRPDVMHRFFNEARAASIIQHPGIAAAYEYGHTPGGVAYMVMEFLTGESLGERLQRRGGRLPEGLNLARQVASALAAAHERGIIHRDLKPGNVMIVPDPEAVGGERAKVLDFGVAKLAAEHQGPERDQFMTRSGMIMGTPVYMSPEQCRSVGEVDGKSDVYALGVMLYQMMSGEPPFMAKGMAEILAMHMFTPAPPLGERSPGISPGVAALIHRMLEKAPEARPGMGEVVSALERLGIKGTQAMAPVQAEAAGRRAASGAAGAGDSVEVALTQLTGPGAATAGATAGRGPAPGPAATGAPLSAQLASQVVAPAGPRRLLLPGAALLLALLGVAGYGALRPRPPAEVLWLIESAPPGAEIVRAVDGVVIGTTPLRRERPAEEGQLPLLLRKAGYADAPLTLDLGRGYQGSVTLRPEAPVPAPAPSANPAAPGADPAAPGASPAAQPGAAPAAPAAAPPRSANPAAPGHRPRPAADPTPKAKDDKDDDDVGPLR